MNKFGLNFCAYFTIFISVILQGFIQAKEVCKFAYMGPPVDYLNKTIDVPDDMVAMSEYLYVSGLKDTVFDTIHQPSIMFVIDHSSSMWSSRGLDRWGNRFRVTCDLIDTIMNHSPYAEVGVAIFNKFLYYDTRDDDIFKQIDPPDTTHSAYIPLLQLNKDYNGKTGYEILKSYLVIDTTIDTIGWSTINGVSTPITVELVSPEYKSGWTWEGATHINAGFNAVVKAMKEAKYPKKSHFVVFFSDGKATHPDNGKNDYIKGVDYPTTYTVFFVKDGGVAPEDLVNMTENVKNNGYSPTNPKSNLWEYKNTSNDALMKFLMENVIKEILNTSVFNPSKIVVNGKKVTNWDSTGFTFDNLFPLKGKKTDFKYNLKYHIWRDTIDAQTGEVVTIEVDTTVKIDFDVKIDPKNDPLPDSLFDVKCWDREIGFYFKDKPVKAIAETMDPLEIRFTYTPGEAKYDYTQAKIELSSTKGKKQDKETFKLKKKGNTFSLIVPRKVLENNETPKVGDGTFQHYFEDKIIAVFRNSEKTKLPLDTLLMKIPTDFGGILEIECAEYFDNNADGYVDSIFIKTKDEIEGGIKKSHIKELFKNALTFPKFRGFELDGDNYGVLSNGFYINVKEDESHDPVTFVSDKEKLKIEKYFFSTGGKIDKKTVKIYDRIAPLIHWKENSAYLIDIMVDSISDTLSVTFSEPVKKIKSEKPFYFLSKSKNKNYTVKLSYIRQPRADKIIFYVKSYKGVKNALEGDSIWIRGDDYVSDIEGNFQNNKKNTRRKLFVERRINYTYIPKAVSPIDIQNFTNFKIPTDIINVFKKDGILKDLKLKTVNESYLGMIIMAVPDPENIVEMLPELKAEGTISIFDPLGNNVIDGSKMAWWPEKHCLVFAWNGKNSNNRSVGSGVYVALIDIQDVTDSPGLKKKEVERKKILLGIKD